MAIAIRKSKQPATPGWSVEQLPRHGAVVRCPCGFGYVVWSPDFDGWDTGRCECRRVLPLRAVREAHPLSPSVQQS